MDRRDKQETFKKVGKRKGDLSVGQKHERKRSDGTHVPLHKGKEQPENCFWSNQDDQNLPTKAENELQCLLGQPRGIQGYNNSCYLDVIIFSLFYFGKSFDRLLHSKPGDNDLSRRARLILKNQIVQSLREPPFYCLREQMQIFRRELAQMNPRVLSSFLAIEDIIHLIFHDALNESNFIEYSEGSNGFMHILMANTNGSIKNITIQENLEFSMMFNGNLKFKKVPSPALILGLPWHKERLFHYSSVAPVPELNISNMCSPAFCQFCNKFAVWESVTSTPNPLPKYFCHICVDYLNGEYELVSREIMRLVAVICYHAYHFTTVTRYRSPKMCSKNIWEETSWIYFNSLEFNGGKVIDITDNLISLTLGADEKCLDTWEQAFMEFHRRFNAHTCIYEPVYY